MVTAGKWKTPEHKKTVTKRMLRHLHGSIATYLVYIAASFNAPSVNVVCNLQSD